MAPLNQTSPSKIPAIRHFTHPKHPLEGVFIEKEYICDGCNTLGSGNRYRCKTCEFDLHENCAKCPLTFSSHVHPQHPLSLVNQAVMNRFCDVCGDNVRGLFYRCKTCEFDVHPLCTHLPMNVKHGLHPYHVLTLQSAQPSWCSVCRKICKFWRYRCNICVLDVHLECVVSQSDVGRGAKEAPGQAPPSPYEYGVCGTPCVVGVPSGGYGYGNKTLMMVNQPALMMNQPASMINHQSSMMNQQSLMMNQPALMMNRPTLMINQQSLMMNQPALMMNQPALMMNQPSMMNQQALMMMQPMNQGQDLQRSTSTNEGTKRNVYSVLAKFAVRAVVGSLLGVPI